MADKKEIKIFLHKVEGWCGNRMEVRICIDEHIIGHGDSLEEAIKDFDNTYIDDDIFK